MPVYEVLDAANFADTTIVELRENDLMGAIEREFTATLAGGTGAS